MWQRKLRQEQERARVEAILARVDASSQENQSSKPKDVLSTSASSLPEPVPPPQALAQTPETDRATSKRKPKTPKRDRLDPRKVRIKGKLFWQVDLGSELHSDRRYRLRRTFASREEAETFSRLKKIERTNRGTAGISLPERLRGEAIEADRLLKPYNVGILEI